MSSRRKLLSVLAVVLLAVAGVYYFVLSHETPALQARLAELNSQNFAAFKTEFNRAADQYRIVLLLSPT